MRNALIILFVVITGCTNSQDKGKQLSSKQQPIEDFNSFYPKFYSDTVFQKERILIPLKGTIKTWEEDSMKEESWANKKITVTPKEKFLQVYQNLKTDIIIRDTVVIEKYWLEQSGFLIEKTFSLRSGKWFLYSYNISNV